MNELVFYLDKECSQQIKKVNWDKTFSATMMDGTTLELKNTVEIGDAATATFYVRNESKYEFYIKKLIFPDKRVETQIENERLLPFVPTKITLSVNAVPDEHEVVEAVQSADFIIKGFFFIT